MTKQLVFIGTLIMLLASAVQLQAQSSTDDILNIMVNKGLITQTEADSMRAEAAISAQSAKEKQKNFTFNTSRLLQFSGYLQLRFQSNQAKGVYDGFDIRRARLDIRGDITKSWEYRLQVDFATVPKILDAYAAFKPFSFFKVQAGQFKIPMSAENIQASNKMEFIDRAQVTEALVFRSRDVLGNNNGRGLGLMGFGSLFKVNDRYMIDYFAGIFDGQGINLPDRNEAKDFGGRLLTHPVKGLDLGGSYYNGYDYMIIKPDTGNFVRIRYAAEAAFSIKQVIFRGEYINGIDGLLRREGGWIAGMWFVWPKRVQLLARYDWYEPDRRKGLDQTTWLTAGFNFIFNNWVKLGLNYTYKSEEGGSDYKINNDLIAVQLQAGF